MSRDGSHGLNRPLGLAGVFAIATGAMISSGLFVLPGPAFEQVGPAVIVSYGLAGLLALTGLLSTAELATAMPKAGSDYYFITRAMGPAVGTVAGLFDWLAFSLKAAFALVGLGALVALFAPIDLRITGAVLGAGFIALNIVGVKQAARVQMVLVGLLLALTGVYVFRGLPAVRVERFADFAPSGTLSVFATAGFVFVAYGGLLKIASVAEEVRHPGRTIPRGLILSLVVTMALYALMVTVTVGVLPGEDLSGSLTPIADAALAFLGRGGQIALGAAGAMAFLTTANAGILTGSRYLLAMSRDRTLPGAVGRVNARFATPHMAVLATGGMAVVGLLVNLKILVEAASVGLILTNIFANLSVIVLREGRVGNYRPTFRAPLYPWVQVVGIVGFGFVLFEMGLEAFAMTAVLALAGFCLYWFYGRARGRQESALLHLVERITDHKLVTGTLEADLKAVIRQRDQIVLDRFDHLIEGCAVIDTPEPMASDALFAAAADRVAPRVGVDAESLLASLRQREAESSTVIGPHLAVPHVVIEGHHAFDVLLARSRAGFAFPDAEEGIHAVFVLVGTRDERNFHLQALSAIAQVVQQSDFEKRWLAAQTDQQLRDVVLLGQRTRRGR
ncbi:MAG: amino acid permease [Phycisphaerae bacterium]|nr:amino acid permease [Phycisphaerae bacterium]